MYDQSVSSTTNSPPGQRGTNTHRPGGGGGLGHSGSGGGGMPQGQIPLPQQTPEYSWNTLDQQPYPAGIMLHQQGPPPQGQTHLQLNLPGPLPPLQAPSGAQGSFWGTAPGSRDSPLQSHHSHSPSTSTASSRGGTSGDGYRQMLHPDEMNSDDEFDSGLNSGPSSTTPDMETPPKKKKGSGMYSIWL